MIKDTGKGDFKPAPAGNHLGVCVRVIDLGTQDETYKGKPKKVEQIMIGWELPKALMEDGLPFMVSRIYTKSLSERANLRSDLENWRGRDFSEEELAGFDERKILGKACLVQVQHNDKGKAKVAAISKVPEGMERPQKPVNAPLYFSLEPELFDRSAFDQLTDWTREKIEKSPEYKAIVTGKPIKPAVSEHSPAVEPRVEF